MTTRSTDDDVIEAEISAAFKGLVHASLALDPERYFAYVDREKFTGLSAHGKVWHCATALEELIYSGFPTIEKIMSLEFSNVKVTVLNPSTAILVNEYQQTILLKNQSIVKQAGGGTQVWSRSGSRWKLVIISASDAIARGDAVF